MATNDPDLKALRDCFSHDTKMWQPIRAEGTTDMQYVAGDPWDPKDRDDRRKHNRPCLNADELSQYINQIVNDVRQNKQSVQFTATGFGANDQSAQFYEDKWREIEYRSKAQIAYTTAFQNAVERSYGFCRVNYRAASPRAPHMDLWIDTIHNPNRVTPDADAQRSDCSDMTRCWVREPWDVNAFDRRFSQAKIATHYPELKAIAHDWFSLTTSGSPQVFVGEYWHIESTRTSLHLFDVGTGQPLALLDDEVDQKPDYAQHLSSRKVEVPRVIQQLTNGIEILEETEWPGKYIPIVGCMGKILYVEESGSQKRQILSAVRLARDPQMLYAYLVTCEAEVIGAMPRFPYFVYEGQLVQSEFDALVKSVTEPVAAIRIRPSVEGLPAGTVLPFPQRNPYQPPLQEIEIAKEAARRAIQSALGSTPLPTVAQRQNEKSGIALQRIAELGQAGNFHFVDHYTDMITQVGIIGEDLLDKIYDTPRQVAVRKQNGTSDQVWINNPSQPNSISTKGEHIVTVSTGPSFDSEREQAADFADTLITSPVVMQAAGPSAPKLIAQAIKLRNIGPTGDVIAEMLDPSLSKQQDPQQMTQQLQQQIQQLQAQLQQLQPLADKNQVDLQKVQLQSQTDLQQTQMELASKEKIAMIQVSGQLSATQAKLDAEDARTFVDAMETRLGKALDLHMARLGLVHEAIQNSQQQTHELGSQLISHAHDALMGQQQAALAPQPTNGNGADNGATDGQGA